MRSLRCAIQRTVMPETIETLRKKISPVKEGEYLLGLSGGADSVALMMILLPAIRTNRIRVEAVHINHGLRGAESDDDEHFCSELCEKEGIPLYICRADLAGRKDEASAREVRYAAFRKRYEETGADGLILAHHADDQAETFFINLLRGAGLNGLKGMKPRNGVIIRPMLWVSRDQICQYAAENHITWREDHTNAESVYLRNKIRNQLLPAFDELQPEARQGLYKSLEHLASENELYRELLKDKLSRIVEKEGDSFCVSLDCFAALAKTQSEQLLFEWLRQYGFNTDQCRFIHEAMEDGVGNKYFSPTHQLVIGRNELLLSEIKSDANEEIQIEIGEEEITSPIHLRFSKYNKSPGFVIDKSPDVALIDADKIHFPLTLRHWQHGDRFHPLGMKGSKLLSDFFVDQKFTDSQKHSVFLLVSADNQIVWVVGHRIDNRFKIEAKTQNIFECRMC